MEKGDKSENSRKNDCTDEEKPLKKARYLWEVKGKSHLKNSSIEVSNGDSSSSPVQIEPGCSREEENNQNNGLSQDISPSCCVQTFLAKTENIMDLHRDDSSDEETETSLLETEAPVSLVSSQPRSQDYYLSKWQARQIARGFVDNTINSMLENWVDRPFDASNFVEDCENDGQVEDDAILMAIQSHGLQSGWRGGQSSNDANFAIASGSNSNTSNEVTVPQMSSDELEQERTMGGGDLSSFSSPSSSSSSSLSATANPYEVDSTEVATDPIDFLNAAVSAAIQKKGLSYG